MGDRPLLLGVGLGGEDDGGVLAHPRGEEGGVGDHRRRLLQRPLPQLAVVGVEHRVAVEEDHGGKVARVERLADRPVVTAGLGRLGEPGPGVGEHPGLAQPAAVGAGGNLEQAGALAAGHLEPGGEVEQGAGRVGSPLPRRQSLAPEDHDLVPGLLQRVGQGPDLGPVGAGGGRGGGERVEVAGVGQGEIERGGEGSAAARGVADAGRSPLVERGGSVGGHEELYPAMADRLAQAQVEDRDVVDRLAVEDQHGVGVVEVGHRGLEVRGSEGPQQAEGQLAAGAAVQVGRAERVTHQVGEQQPLLIAGLAADQCAGPASGTLERGDRGADGQVPADRAQLAAVAEHRRGNALVNVDRLVGKAALVAEPAVVDAFVVALQDAQDALVADGEADVALGRAEGADRPGLLDVPGPGAEAVGARGERANGAELDDVAAERGHVGVPVEGGDVGLVAALLEHELVILGDLLAVTDAAVAEDAALAVDGHQRREGQRLLEVALGLHEAGEPPAPAERLVLERAFAALVADRAVERVVDEDELEHRLLCRLDLRRVELHLEPLADRHAAAGLELAAHALDLHQAHPAGADRRPDLLVVTEDGDLGLAVLQGGVGEHHALRRLDLAAVDGELHHLHFGARHQASTPPVSARSRRSRAASISASNSSRNLAISEPTGIAMASPSTQRQWPMI